MLDGVGMPDGAGTLASDGEILIGMVVDFGVLLITTMALGSMEGTELHITEVIEIEVIEMHMRVITEIAAPTITDLVAVPITTEVLTITEEEYLLTTTEEQDLPLTRMEQDHVTITYILVQDPVLLAEVAQESITEVDQEAVLELEVILDQAEVEVQVALLEVVVPVVVVDLDQEVAAEEVVEEEVKILSNTY